MFISCEQCLTDYSLDDYLVAPEGISVQCTRCGHIFMAMPPEAKAQTLDDASSQPAPFHGEEEKKEKAPLGATQIFGVLPFAESPSVPTSPPSSPSDFRYMTEAPPDAQSPAGPYKDDAKEVAYIDFGVEPKPNEAGQLSSHFTRAASTLPEKFPVATPPAPSSSASAKRAVSPSLSSSSPPAQRPTASLFEQTVEPEQQGFSEEATEHQAELSNPSHVVEQREQAFPAKPAKKQRPLLVFFVLLVAVILAVFSGMWLSLSQQL